MQEQGAEGIHDASRGASGSDKSDGELGPVNLHSRRQHQQQLHRQLRAAGHQAGQADFGTYTQAAPLGTTASAIESPTFVGLACNRTVRDRQLAIEKTFFDLHNRKLDDVKPLEWQNADYEMEQNNRELERIIKEDIEEREVAHQAACQRQAEADTEAALQKEAVARLRKEAAAAAQSEQMDGSTERNLQEAGGTPTGRGTAAIGEERGSQLEEDEAS
uniref:Uncharacterized protein n=1 Tax=Dunaliella tertiolecta TaxID=3047 RepID=A0A7S3VQX2_DUNTE